MKANKKILIIGQAPPAKEQKKPYDSTLLYNIFGLAGISDEDAKGIFEFNAISNTFRGSKNGNHLRPLRRDVEAHFPALYKSAKRSAGIITLGEMARNEWSHNKGFYQVSESKWQLNPLYTEYADITLTGVESFIINEQHYVFPKVLSLPHPSRRNYRLIRDNMDTIVSMLQNFVREYANKH